MRLLDHPAPECAQSKLYDGSVEEDLRLGVGTSDRLLDMRHEEHVTCTREVVLQAGVVDVGKHGPGSEEGGRGFVKLRRELSDEFRSGRERRGSVR